jgi:hypothetical protein
MNTKFTQLNTLIVQKIDTFVHYNERVHELQIICSQIKNNYITTTIKPSTNNIRM